MLVISTELGRSAHQGKKRIFSFLGKLILGIAVFCLMAFGTAFILIFHGPFTELKELYVTTAMTTYTHQYLAHWFVSDEEIAAIMVKNKVPEPKVNTDEKAVAVLKPLEKEKPALEFIEVSGKGYKGYLLKVGDPQRVQLVATEQLGSLGLKVAEFVANHQAVAGINAGGFSDPGGVSHGGTPTGILMTGGRIIHKDPLEVYNLIGLDKNHVLVLGRYTLEQIEELGIRDAVSFAPFLIVNGEPMIKAGDGGWGIAPRTAIGQTRDGTILLLVIDGRQLGSIGATLRDVQDILLEHGAVNGANLDGGSSSTLVYQGEVKNKPSSQYGPREVPSAFIVMREEGLSGDFRQKRLERLER
nr:phosphodiester glycosidase family protein [Desulfitobacterium dichloroeliminans]